ncbi:MAG: 4,5-DOPA dioxygenase extradiol [Candidatus Eremiobacteraeota bacterium]|nr:4,5-DOPA dioxygenase extradiol [Candidatus Eremiobacteraeota bacterium]
MARLPAIFFGHGNPMNALATNAYTQAWSALGAAIPRPRAILAISAHWYLPGVHVTASRTPRTIHDFGGFPRELYEVRYPAPGDPGLATRVQELLAPVDVARDERWGFDHGTWSVLVHVYPNADVPIVQLALDETKPPSFHYDLGKRLAPLRDEGVLIVGSGNLVHNLHALAWGSHPARMFDWAERFERQARDFLIARDHEPLIEYEDLGRDALLAVPTPDHYLPLLYVIATQQDGDAVTFPVEGGDAGSISMLSVRIG